MDVVEVCDGTATGSSCSRFSGKAGMGATTYTSSSTLTIKFTATTRAPGFEAIITALRKLIIKFQLSQMLLFHDSKMYCPCLDP